MRPLVEKDFRVHIVAGRPRSVLYTGMTSDLVGRTEGHRERPIDGFTRMYWAERLVWYERHTEPETALRREKAIKRWRRDWKIELIEEFNPIWRDLFSDILTEQGFTPEPNSHR